MGVRFRKRVKLAPGVYLNLGKTGVSASVGPRGATLNVSGKRKPKVTAGIPGSGLSASSDVESGSVVGWLIVLLILAVLAAVFG